MAQFINPKTLEWLDTAGGELAKDFLETKMRDNYEKAVADGIEYKNQVGENVMEIKEEGMDIVAEVITEEVETVVTEVDDIQTEVIEEETTDNVDKAASEIDILSMFEEVAKELVAVKERIVELEKELGAVKAAKEVKNNAPVTFAQLILTAQGTKEVSNQSNPEPTVADLKAQAPVETQDTEVTVHSLLGF